MRLTLRTLLAYRDGVLSPADSEDLHRRIQQSEDAGNLLKRINATSKRIHGASPRIVGKGLGGDPNSIAEYLDDVLHGEKVPELERICLESDAHLAELAACHSLLSSAMHTRVPVPESLRRLAIEIESEDRRDEIKQGLKTRRHEWNAARPGQILRADAAHAAPSSTGDEAEESQEHTVQVQAPMVASGGGTIKQQGLNLEGSALAREVPEYLVGTHRGSWRIPLGIGALAALLGVLIWQTLGPWDGVMALFTATPPAESPEDTSPPSAPEDVADPGQSSADSTKVPGEPTDADAPPGGQDGGPDSASEILESNEPPPGVEDPADSGDTSAGAAENQSNEASENPTPDPPPGSGEPPVPDTSAGAWRPKDDAEKDVVLLVREGGKLVRLQPGQSIGAQELIVPPYFRTTIDMPGGVLWTTCGPSLLTLGEPGTGQVTTSLCRGLIRSGPDGNALKLSSPVGNYQVVLEGDTSMASVEFAYRPKVHGPASDRSVYQPILLVIAVEGQVVVSDGASPDAAPIRLDLGSGVAFMENANPKNFKLQNIPRWYRSSVERPIDGLAAEDLVAALVGDPDQADGAVGPVLNSLTRNRKPETAALAVQTSLLAGRWEPFLQGFLGNERLRSHWSPTLDLATQLIAAEPQRVDSLRNQLSAVSPKGDTLFQMLVGLTEDQLASDGLSSLIGQLGEDDLASRVLSSYQLQKLTGKTLGYLPYAPNRASIQQWRRELATGRLRLTAPQDVIHERMPR